MADAERSESIKTLFQLSKAELDSQLRSVDALDMKGSILIGSAAALLTLTYLIVPDVAFAWVGFLFFGAATVLGVLGVWLVQWSSVPSPLRIADDRKHGIPLEKTLEGAMGAVCIALDRNSRRVQRKVRFLKAGLVSIALGTVWVCMCLVLEEVAPARISDLLWLVFAIALAMFFCLMIY